MHPLLRAVLATAIMAALSQTSEPTAQRAAALGSLRLGPADGHPRDRSAQCPAGTLPDEGVCIPAIDPEAALRAASSAKGAPFAPTVAESVPRAPDRPESGAAYDLGVEVTGEARVRGGRMLIPCVTGAVVRSVFLEGQQAPSRVLSLARDSAPTVATLHSVVRAGASRDFVVILRELEQVDAAVTPGANLPSGARLGVTRARDYCRLSLEVRQAREGVKLSGLKLEALMRTENTFSIDPRNALPLKR